MVETMPTQETASTSPFSSENSKPQQQPPQEVQPQPQRPADETLIQDQVSRILAMLDERIVEAMKRELAGEKLPIYIVDQDFVTLGWNPKQLEHARRAFKSEIRDATQYKVSLPSRDLGGGVVGWAFWNVIELTMTFKSKFSIAVANASRDLTLSVGYSGFGSNTGAYSNRSSRMHGASN